MISQQKDLVRHIVGVKNLMRDLNECVKGDAHNMKMFKNSEFNAVTLSYSLHHMDDPNVVLQEAKRVLKPDGKIIIVEYIIRKRRSKCHRFTRKEVSKMLENAGFKNIVIQKLEVDLILVISKKRCKHD